MRLFAAIAAPPVRAQVGVAGAKAIGKAPDHLTVRFLGETEPTRLPAVRTALGSAARSVPPFRIVLQGIGGFPSLERPRVLFAAVSIGATSARELAGAVDRALAAAGFPSDARPFVPHLTLLRVRSPREAARVEALRELPSDRPLGEIEVTELLLVESVLGHDGARHTVLDRFPLATAP